MLNREQAKARLTKIFHDVLDDDSIILTDKTPTRDVEEWDSLEYINLIGATEKEFKMRFSVREVSSMKNVGEMLDIICQRAGK
ncbi:MAG: acyl carrier protein [Oscillospiraceae bacterium]